MSKMMKAIVVEAYGGPEVMKLRQVAVPGVGDGQVLVRVQATGVNPVDVYIRDNRFGANTKLPYTPGSDCAGVVEKVGSGVSNLKVGDKIFTLAALTGTYAEFALCKASMVFPIPGSDNGKALSFAQASGIGVPYFTAYRALFQKARVQDGESVLVHGASGAVGIACIQLLRALAKSVRIVGTAGSEEGLQLVKQCGADATFNHRQAGYVDEVVAAQPSGFDVIVEMLANENLANDTSRMVGQNGRILIVGSRDNCTISPRALMKKESSVHGVALRASTAAETEVAAEAICRPSVAKFIEPAVDRAFDLADADKAHVYVMESSGHRGKVVLNVRKDDQ